MLHEASLLELGYSPLKLQLKSSAGEQEEIELSHLLGRGAAAEVYQITLGGQPTLVKVFNSPRATEAVRKELCETEEKMLKLLKERCLSLVASGQITSIVEGYSAEVIGCESSALLLRPVGQQFACTVQEHLRASQPEVWAESFYPPVCRCLGEDLAQAVLILKVVHKAGIVHRDLTLGNMFRGERKALPPVPAPSAAAAAAPAAPTTPSAEGKRSSSFLTLVNDWGCAQDIKIRQTRSSAVFQGSVWHASFSVLNGLQSRSYPIQFMPKDDLHSLVCCAFHAACPLQYELYLKREQFSTEESVQSFWTAVAASEPWKTLFSLAQGEKYDELARSFRELVPVFQSRAFLGLDAIKE